MSRIIRKEQQENVKQNFLTDTQKQRIEEIISQMTVREKAGQLNQIAPSIVGGFDVSFEELIEMLVDGRITQEEFHKIMESAEQDFHEDLIEIGEVGSLMIQDPEKFNELQKIAVEKSRLGIPLISAFDVIHGYRTIFPTPLAQACSFDEDSFERTGHIQAKEARSRGIQWGFSPMLDIARDARWGRICESPGEDPYLSSVFARARVRGMQGSGNDTHAIDQNHIAACLKHYVAYGAAEGGQDYNTVSMAKSMLHNGYMPAFLAGVKEGAISVMAAFNDYNGVPCTVNSYLLRDVLKEHYGFEGLVVSDANAIKECINHGFARDLKEAAMQAVNAGLDMDMGTSAFIEHIPSLVEEEKVSIEVLDEAVRRILGVKMALGLFDQPYVPKENIHQYDTLPKEHRAEAFDAAKKSIVLLKNEGNILPLGKEAKIALVGELASSDEEMLGAWSASGLGKECITILDGMKEKSPNLVYAKCCDIEGEFEKTELDSIAKEADVIVIVAGEKVKQSGEAASRADITLPGKQQELIQAALDTGKPVVLLLINGRPLALAWEAEHVPAILECWHLGSEAGNAIAEVVFGDFVPTGKLSATFPAVTGQCPRYYNHPSTGRPGSKSKFTSRYLDAPLEPLYPFGYGLSYTTFIYENLQVTQDAKEITARVTITNTGERAGAETLQLYIRDVTASLVRPVKELKGFQKVVLEPNESRKITFTLSKEDIGFYDDEMNYHLEDGEFVIFVGGNCVQCLESTIEIQFDA